MITNEDILCALEYGLTAAHIKCNNKDYYGEIYGYWDEKEEHFNVHLSNLLLPVGGGLWKMTNKRSQTFTLNKNNCKLMKLKCIEGQNFIGGHTALGFTYIKIYEYKRKFDDNNIYFMKKNGVINSNVMEKINDTVYEVINNKIFVTRQDSENEIKQLKNEIKQLKNLLNKKDFLCSKCKSQLKYDTDFPLCE